jgi:hypothetical protein
MKHLRNVIIFLLLSVMVVAAPPILENHQFYGDVTWNLEESPVQVIASVGGIDYPVDITGSVCTEVCVGKYGYEPILRVQGAGEITFFIDDKEVTKVDYIAWEKTKLDLSISTLEPACVSNWNYTEWTDCVESNQTRDGTDLNVCEPDKTFSRICSDEIVATVPLTCLMEWECTGWSICTGSQTRTCERVDVCVDAVEVAKPIEQQACVKAVTKTSDFTTATPPTAKITPPKPKPTLTPPEKSVPKEVEEESSNTLLFVGVGVLLLLVIVGMYFVFRKKPDQVPVQY